LPDREKFLNEACVKTVAFILFLFPMP